MLSGPTAFYTVLTTVRDACKSALAADLPKTVTIVPGAIAWDDCDQCGLLALAESRHFLADEFPVEVTTTMEPQPGAVLCADCVVQIVRCAPQPQGNALAPTSAAQDASAKQVTADAYNVLCATIGALEKLKVTGDIYDYLIRQQPFAGPAGACVGSELQFVVGVIR